MDNHKKTDKTTKIEADTTNQPVVSAGQSANNTNDPVVLPSWNKETYNALPVAVENAKSFGERLRENVISVTPDAVLRNSATIVSGMHVASELFMLKAAGVVFTKTKIKGDKPNYLVDPVRNVMRSITGRDRERGLQNEWSTRSTTAGFTSYLLGTVVPDKKRSEDDKEPQEETSSSRFSGYDPKQIFNAIQIGNPNTKRQQVGLGVTAAGIFSAISGFHNINVKTGKRFINTTHTISGCITTLAASQLLFSKTDEDGWKRFGTTIWLHTPFAIASVHRKYTGGDRWAHYGLGKAGFQAAAVVAYLIGGAQKNEQATDTIEEQDNLKHELTPKDSPELTPEKEPEVEPEKQIHVAAQSHERMHNLPLEHNIPTP